jgi:PAS domain S-box-containing protein
MTADAALQNERELLRQLMDSIPDAVCFKDRERKYTHLNHAERLILNIQSDRDAIGKTVDELMTADRARKRRIEEERVLATGETLVGYIEKMVEANGRVRWITSTKAPLRDRDGEVVGIVEVTRDITERKRQQQLREELIAAISHELRTPLTSIVGAVSCLMGGAAGKLPDAAIRLLTIANNNCRRLAGMVNDVLDNDKTEAANERRLTV